MKNILFISFSSLALLLSHPCVAEETSSAQEGAQQLSEDSKSSVSFGMGSGTPTRSGNNVGWGFGPVEDKADQSSASGGFGFGSGRSRGYNRPYSQPFFSFGNNRGYYGPPPGYQPYPQQYPQQQYQQQYPAGQYQQPPYAGQPYPYPYRPQSQPVPQQQPQSAKDTAKPVTEEK